MITRNLYLGRVRDEGKKLKKVKVIVSLIINLKNMISMVKDWRGKGDEGKNLKRL